KRGRIWAPVCRGEPLCRSNRILARGFAADPASGTRKRDYFGHSRSTSAFWTRDSRSERRAKPIFGRARENDSAARYAVCGACRIARELRADYSALEKRSRFGRRGRAAGCAEYNVQAPVQAEPAPFGCAVVACFGLSERSESAGAKCTPFCSGA